MNKLAVFVEGFTEVLFVGKLIEEIAGKNAVLIEQRRIVGGSNAPRKISIVKAARPVIDEVFFVLIIDCGGDHQVASRIREEHEGLTKKGYSKIIGLRDVRPDFVRADVTKLESFLKKYIKTKLIPVEFVLGIMEIEAWFLSEMEHFRSIDRSLTKDVVKQNLHYDPEISPDLIDNPAADLNAIYSLVGATYAKPGIQTVEALDYENIYLNVRDRIPYLDRLIKSIEVFLNSPRAEGLRN